METWMVKPARNKASTLSNSSYTPEPISLPRHKYRFLGECTSLVTAELGIKALRIITPLRITSSTRTNDEGRIHYVTPRI